MRRLGTRLHFTEHTAAAVPTVSHPFAVAGLSYTFRSHCAGLGWGLSSRILRSSGSCDAIWYACTKFQPAHALQGPQNGITPSSFGVSSTVTNQANGTTMIYSASTPMDLGTNGSHVIFPGNSSAHATGCRNGTVCKILTEGASATLPKFT